MTSETSTSSPTATMGDRTVPKCVANCSGKTVYDRKFKTAEDAAVAAMQEANPRSHVSNREIGGWVRKNDDGTFTPRRPVTGTADSLPNMPSPESSDVVWWHTHAAYDPAYDSENFSQGDRGYSNHFGKPGYVATPAGAIRVYDPSDGSERTLPATTSADPKNP